MYYGVTFAMNQIGLNVYANTLIVGGAEALAYMVTSIIVLIYFYLVFIK